MTPISRLLFALLIVCFAVTCQAQKDKTTIILVRHAEKDPAGGNDPGLTPAGQARAAKLATLFPNATPTEMYATPYTRTRATLEPWAGAVGVKLQSYNPSNLPEFADLLLQQTGKTIVVAGHSNTTPALANLLLKTDRYKAWQDDEYNKLFVIEVVKGKAKGKVIEY